MRTVLDLPADVLQLVASHLSQDDRKQLRCSCRRWRHHKSLLTAGKGYGHHGQRLDTAAVAILLRLRGLSKLRRQGPPSLLGLQQLAGLTGLTKASLLGYTLHLDLAQLRSLSAMRSLMVSSAYRRNNIGQLTQLSELNLKLGNSCTGKSIAWLSSLQTLKVGGVVQLAHFTACAGRPGFACTSRWGVQGQCMMRLLA